MSTPFGIYGADPNATYNSDNPMDPYGVLMNPQPGAWENGWNPDLWQKPAPPVPQTPATGPSSAPPATSSSGGGAQADASQAWNIDPSGKITLGPAGTNPPWLIDASNAQQRAAAQAAGPDSMNLAGGGAFNNGEGYGLGDPRNGYAPSYDTSGQKYSKMDDAALAQYALARMPDGSIVSNASGTPDPTQVVVPAAGGMHGVVGNSPTNPNPTGGPTGTVASSPSAVYGQVGNSPTNPNPTGGATGTIASTAGTQGPAPQQTDTQPFTQPPKPIQTGTVVNSPTSPSPGPQSTSAPITPPSSDVASIYKDAGSVGATAPSNASTPAPVPQSTQTSASPVGFGQSPTAPSAATGGGTTTKTNFGGWGGWGGPPKSPFATGPASQAGAWGAGTRR